MENKVWDYGTENGMQKQLVYQGHLFRVDKFMTIFLTEKLISPTGVVISTKPADYQIIKGKISTDILDNPLPKKNTEGQIIYKLDDDGNKTDIPEYRDNAFENIIFYINNKIFTISELIDEGVKERFKLNNINDNNQ